eukprot:266585-Pelagomonas_calceolata.AAC.2
MEQKHGAGWCGAQHQTMELARRVVLRMVKVGKVAVPLLPRPPQKPPPGPGVLGLPGGARERAIVLTYTC